MAKPLKSKPESTTYTDTSLFTEEELKQLEEEANAEFEQETKKASQEAFKEETKRKLRQKALFSAGKDATGDDVEPVMIKLAPHSSYISLDGRLYYHGVSYKFTQAQAQTIKDQMHRTWEHEREIGGANIIAERGTRSFNERL